MISMRTPGQLLLQFIVQFQCSLLIPCVFIYAATSLFGETQQASKLDISSILEIESSIRRGSTFLFAQQNANGSWSGSVETTALCLTAIVGSVDADVSGYTNSVSNARTYLIGFLTSNLPQNRSQTVDFNILHSMAVSLVPIVLLDNPVDDNIIERTRQLLKYTFVRLWDKYTPDQQRDYGLNLYQVHHIFEVLMLLTPRQQKINYQQHTSPVGISDTWEKLMAYVYSCQYTTENTAESGGRDIIGTFENVPIKMKTPAKITAMEKCRLFNTCLYTLSGMTTLMYADRTLAQPPFQSARSWLLRNKNTFCSINARRSNTYTFLHALSKYCRQVVHHPNVQGDNEIRWQISIINWLLSKQRGPGYWEGIAGSHGEDDNNLCTAYAILSMLRCLE